MHDSQQAMSAPQTAQSLPETENRGHLTIGKDLEVPDGDLNIWREDILPRLEMEFMHKLRDCSERFSACVLDFCMAGSSASDLQPTIVITCFHAECKAHLRKILAGLSWLPEYHYPQEIVLELIRYLTLGKPPISNRQSSPVGSRLLDVSSLWIYHTQPLQIMYQREANRGDQSTEEERKLSVLGGYIVIEDILYGLTTSHGFFKVCLPSNWKYDTINFQQQEIQF